MPDRTSRVPFLLGFLLLLSASAFCQTELPGPLYRGPNVHITGVYVTPVPSAPFSATVTLESSQLLPDGSTVRKKTINFIARDSGGRIHNEDRTLMPEGFTGTPRLLSTHIYDPVTRVSTYLNPFTRLARQMVLPAPAQTVTQLPAKVTNNPFIKDEDLGTQTLQNLTIHGLRRSTTIPANHSDTGKEIVITDEYWYSDDLHIIMLIKHSDPRSGDQQVTVTQVNRTEPDATLFQIPPEYKVVDETPNTK